MMTNDGALPDFYLASTEGYDLDTPRRCWRIRRLATQARNDLLVARVDPPLIYQNLPVEEVVLAARHVGRSVLDIDEWPIYVHVAVLFGENDGEGAAELINIAWGALYPNEEDANAAVGT